MAQGSAGSTRGGFQGSVESLPLVDLLQVWSMNRFSGLVTVSFHGRTGQLYLVEGELVHAEADGLAGERAVAVIIGWPEGSFELFPNTTALNRTIHKSFSHLLLDAHRELDERGRGIVASTPERPTPPVRPSASEPSRPGVLDQIRAIPGVTRLVRCGRDGRPSGDAGPEAEALAARGLYLALTHAASVASAFGLHELALATLQGERESFVLIHSNASYLCIAVAPGTAMEPVVMQLRGLLTRPASR